MPTVGTAELKNNLSLYLRRVREGAEVIITDRGIPIAKLAPLDVSSNASLPERLAGMVAEGLVSYDFNARPKPSHRKVDLGGDLASQYLVNDRT